MTDRQRTAILLVLLALLARAGMLFFYLRAHHWVAETWEYERIALNLLSGNGYTYLRHGVVYHALVVPLFPFLCAGLHWIGGGGLWLYFAVQLAGAGGVVALTYLLATRLLPPRTALLVGLGVAFDPGLIIYHSYKVDPVTVCQLLAWVGIWAVIPEQGNLGLRRAALGGVILGLAALTRPDMIALGVVLFFLLALSRRKLGIAPSALAALSAGFLIILAPWSVRNFVVLGTIKPFSTVSTEMLWVGNNPNATGSAIDLNGKSQFSFAPIELKQKIGASKTELDVEAAFREEAIRYIRAEPKEFLARCVRKFAYFWWFTPTFGTLYGSWISSLAISFYVWAHRLALVLIGLGVWQSFRERDPSRRFLAFSLSAFPLLFALIHALYYVEGRHRVLTLPFMLIIAALGAHGVSRQRIPVRGEA